MRHSITEPMPPRPTDGGRSASLGQRAAENESDPQAAAKKHASGKPDRARTKPPTYGEPALRKADERTRAMPLAGDSRPELAAKSARMRTAVGRPATPTCSMGWGCPTAKAREQLLGADIAQGGAAGHPRLQGLDVAQRIGKHVEHQLERAIDSLFGIDGFLDALGANLGEPQFEGLGLRRRNRLDDAEDTVSCRVCNAPIS